MSRTFLIVAAICAAPTAGIAEQVAAANFSKLRQTTAYQQAVIAGAYKSGAWLADTCDDAKATIGDRLSVVGAPVVVDERLLAQSGSWVEHVTVEGCAKSRRLNVLVGVRAPGSIATVPMLPGTTHADPVLQRDGATYAYSAAVIDPKGCKPIYVADTEYVGPTQETPRVAGKPGWTEQWTIAQCDKRTVIEMRFVPDEKGTTVVAHRRRAP